MGVRAVGRTVLTVVIASYGVSGTDNDAIHCLHKNAKKKWIRFHQIPKYGKYPRIRFALPKLREMDENTCDTYTPAQHVSIDILKLNFQRVDGGT